MAIGQRGNDAGRVYAIKVLKQFYINGRETPSVGDIVTLRRDDAATVLHSGKGVLADHTDVQRPLQNRKEKAS